MEKTDKVVKEKKKLTKIQIVKLIMAGLSAMCLILAIVFTCIKTPIEGSIYRINTSQKQREKTWENKRDELFDYFDQSYLASDFEDEIETSIWTKFIYKFSYSNETPSSKQLNIELFNYSEKTVKILGSVHVEHRDDEFDYRIDGAQDDVLTSKASVNYSLTVGSDFNIEECFVSIYNVDSNNDGVKDVTFSTAKIFEEELERTKTFKIYDEIEEMIGERPTNEYETTEPRPHYMVEIINARVRFIIFYFLAVIFLVFAIVIRKSKSVSYHVPFVESAKPVKEDEFVIDDEPVREVIIKEIHHAPKIKKVVCLHCGSRYKDNLDECPNCGSSKIENETNDLNNK